LAGKPEPGDHGDMPVPASLAAAWLEADDLRSRGDLVGARQVMREAAESGHSAYGREHPDVLETDQRLAALHAEAGDLAEARRVLEEALAAARLRRPESDPVVVGISAQLAPIADELGNVHEARRHYMRVARFGPDLVGADHPEVRAAFDYLGPEAPQQAPVYVPPPRPDEEPTQPPIAALPGDADAEAPSGGQLAGPPSDAAVVADAAAVDDPGTAWPVVDAGAEVLDDSSDVGRAAVDAGGAAACPAERPGYYQGPTRASRSPPVLGPAHAGRDKSRLDQRSKLPSHRSPRRSTKVLVVPMAVAIIIAAALAVIAVLLPPGNHSGARTVTTGAVAPTLTLTDQRSAVILSWTDPSGGKTAFSVAGGLATSPVKPIRTVPAGTTRLRLSGLDPNLDYCYTVAAVRDTSGAGASSVLVCTNRHPSPSHS
jgi:hypothetical protein